MNAETLRRIIDDPSSSQAERAAAQRQLDATTGKSPELDDPVERAALSPGVRWYLDLADHDLYNSDSPEARELGYKHGLTDEDMARLRKPQRLWED